MQRRRFLEFAGRLGAGSGIALHALPGAGKQTGQPGQSAPTLAFPLDGEWLIATDPSNSGREQKWFLAPKPEAKTTPVPSIIQEAFPAYHGVVWYWRKFGAAPLPYVNGRYLLRFNAVDYLTDIWLNGVHLGSHEGGETPFVLDATNAIRRGQSNDLAVRVLNPSDERIDGIVLPETPHRNKFTKYTNGALPDYGGIIEPVELLLSPAVRITDVHLRPNWESGVVPVTVTLQNTLSKTIRARVHFVVTGTSVAQAIVADFTNVELPPGETGVTHELAIRNHRLWDLSDP